MLVEDILLNLVDSAWGEIRVNIRQRYALCIHKALKVKAMLNAVHLCDAKQIGNHRAIT